MRFPAKLLPRDAAGPGETSLSSSLPTSPPEQQTASVMAVNLDTVVIVALLMCALICVLLVSRCVRRRRHSASSSSASSFDPPPKGLEKEAIDALPTVSFAAAASPQSSTAGACSSSLECAICLAEFADQEDLRVLPQCGHGFHVACVDTWLQKCATCPSCRATIVATPTQPPLAPKVAVVVAANCRCGRFGEVAALTGSWDGTFFP